MIGENSSRIPPWLLALGQRSLPEYVVLKQKKYRLTRVFKHDFWAASGLYSNGSKGTGRVVIKIYRQRDLLGLPMKWLGRWLAGREIGFYSQLQDLPGIPELVAKLGPNGFIHSYVPGPTLLECPKNKIDDSFFDRLADLMGSLHRRGMSYMDANKKDNVIVGADGQPYLIDFQISWRPNGRGYSRLSSRALRFMQRMDFYHLFKHKSRLRPDLMRPQEWHLRRNPGRLLRLHRLIGVPFRDFRRITLRRLNKTIAP